jgi:protocadherin fat 2
MTIQAFDCDENDELRYEIGNFNIFQDSKKRLESEYYFNTFELSRFGKHCPISINPITGDLVTTDELDREMAETIQLQIVVRDKANHVGKKQVMVILEDVNDNYPVFVSPNAIVLFGSRIKENQVLGVITAIDADAGINSVITYKLDSESKELFNLDPKTGQLRARHPLDTRMQKVLTVMATDGAGLMTSDELNFILISRSRYLNQIQVSELTLEVYENEPFGVRLHKFKCMSPEAIEKCEFFINKAKDRTFAVDQYSGDLYLKSVLDREATDYHNLELIAIQGIQVHINKVSAVLSF